MTSDGVVSKEFGGVQVRVGDEGPSGGLASTPSDSEQRVQSLARRFELLSQTAAELLAGEDTQSMVDRLCRRVMEHLDCQVFFNFLVDEPSGRLRLNACAGIDQEQRRELEWLDMGVAVCGCVAQSGRRIVAEDLGQSDDIRTALVRSYGVQAYACHPLLARGRAIGTLSFGSRNRTRFSDDDLSVMKAVAGQVAMAMERIGLLAEARRQAAALAKANSAKDQFLAMLSHELRTPLTPVLLTASMLEQRRDLPTEVRADLTMIRRNVLLEARIIDDLLDLTHMAKGRLECHFRAVDIHAIIRAAADVCGQGEGAAIVLDLRARPCAVRGDSGRLQQVLWNLLCNARKYTPHDGRITVRTTTVEEAGPGPGSARVLQVDVIDTGEGIEPGMLEHIFNAFEQEERQFGGLGLGLSISRAIARAHDGSLEAHSAGRGKGSIFTLRLPLGAEQDVESPAAPGPVEADERPRQGQPAPHAPQGQSHPPDRAMRILLVEDHDTTLRILEKLLSGMGHQVHATSSVSGAIRATQAGRFDIVVSDLGLPDGNGHDMMRFLRDRYGLSGIALSGFGTEEDVMRSRESGFIEHITKPVDVRRLMDAVVQARQRLSGSSLVNS